MAADRARVHVHPASSASVKFYADLFLVTSVGVTETRPMRNKVAIELKS